MTAPLVWGVAELDRDDEATYEIEALVGDGEDLDFGDGAAIEVALRSLLQDGSVVFSQGNDNREVTIAVAVRGTTSDALAQAESALMRQIGRPGVNLVWNGAADHFGAPAVFEVVTSTLAYRYNANREHALSRRYVIRLVCLPWVRSTDLVVSSAPVPPGQGGTPVEPLFVSIDHASSLARWSSSKSAPTAAESGTAVTRSGSNGTDLIYTASSPVPTHETPYLVVDFKTAGSAGALVAYADGVVCPVQSIAPSPDFAGYQQAILRAPDAQFTVLRIVVPFNPERPGGSLTVTNLARASFPPSAGTDRQTFRRLPITGSVRTQGSLRVEHPTAALGDVLLYTWANDGSAYLPPLSPYRPGTPLAVTGTVSGSADNLDTPATFSVPAAAVPAGSYQILARLRSATAGPFAVTYTAKTTIGDTTLDATDAPVSDTVEVDFAAGGSFWQITPLGALQLPTVRLGGTGTVVITLAAGDPAASSLELDEVWLLNTDIGSYTLASCGTGAPTPGGQSRRLWVDPETVAEKATILRGHTADRSDAFYAGGGLGGGIGAVGIHELRPEEMNVFTVTTGTPIQGAADTTVEYYPRWHTHPVT